MLVFKKNIHNTSHSHHPENEAQQNLDPFAFIFRSLTTDREIFYGLQQLPQVEIITLSGKSKLAANYKYANLRYMIDARINKIWFYLDYLYTRKLKTGDYLRRQGPQVCSNLIDADLLKLRSFRRRLDNNYTIAYKLVYDDFKSFGSADDHMLRLFGFVWINTGSSIRSRLLSTSVAHLSYRQSKSRVAEFTSRLLYESHDRSDWYPVFLTLTASDDHYDYVFSKGSSAWRVFLAKLKVWSGDMSYLAVLEFGGKTGRAHIHAILFLRDLPAADPNAGLRLPVNKEIDEIKRLWIYGHSSPIAIRTSPTDQYGSIGWRWPSSAEGEKIRRKPLTNRVSGHILYILKYLLKAYLVMIRTNIRFLSAAIFGAARIVLV